MNAAIIMTLGTWAESDGRGYVFDSNTGFTLPDGSMRSPDAAWVKKTRWDALSAQDQERFSHICPEFIIELRSPSDNLGDLKAKMERWIANSVELAWLIDATDRTVLVYRRGDSPEVHHHPTSVQASGVMAGFELVIARIWE